jgi:hypothetical protein
LLLQKLVEAGHLMSVEGEYRLQTREGVRWTHDFNRSRAAALADDQRINSKRAELLRDGVKLALRPVSLFQGSSKEKRTLNQQLSSGRPSASADEITLWLRDGWSDDEKSVLNDARAAGVDSPMLFGYLPRLHHEELRQAIASHIAAHETLDQHGPVATPEAIEARKAIETHLEVSRHRINELLGQIVGGAKVFLGGGQEANGIELADKVGDSANSALTRLFPHFSDADHANWGQVRTRASGGDPAALSQVAYSGDPIKHPVCRRVIDFIGAGKKGKEIREQFRAAPFGWPQDAVDGALIVMLVAGNLRATLNGNPALPASLPQNQIGAASFFVDVPPLTVQQRLEIKALFSKAGVVTQSGKESEAAAQFLSAMLSLASGAGGDAPRPESPSSQHITELQSLSGNAQLLKIHEQSETLTANAAAWKRSAESIARRMPAWDRLRDMVGFSKGIATAEAYATSTEAIRDTRALLAEPDAIPELTVQITTILRDELSALQAELTAAFERGHAMIDASDLWNRLSEEQRATLSGEHQLSAPTAESLATEADIVGVLRARNLADRRNQVDAVSPRFARALADAQRLLEPKAQKLQLPNATVRDSEELEKWLSSVRYQAEALLKSGPVIL